MKSLRFRDGPSPCIYLPDETATLEYEIVARLSPHEYEQRMNAGWRKFGRFLFHPVCDYCRECRPLRVPVAEFRPNRTQRRCLRRNEDLEVRFGKPTVDSARLALWDKYHAAQSERKGWPYEQANAWSYAFTYVKNPIPSLEAAVYDSDELVAVALLDLTPNAVSGIYHYHDPDKGERSLGKYVMLNCFYAARELGKAYFYLGYYVAGCGSMRYKAEFRPCEALSPEGEWVRIYG